MNNEQLTEKEKRELMSRLPTLWVAGGTRILSSDELELFFRGCESIITQRVALAKQEAYEECSNAVLTLMPQKNVTGLTEKEYEKAEVIADVLCELEKLTSGGGKAE